MDKKTNSTLMRYAEEELQSQNCPLFKDSVNKIIHESYNGQCSSFGVSVLTIGLKATLSVYYQDQPNKINNITSQRREAYRYCLLKVIHGMLKRQDDLETFVREIMSNTDNENSTLKRDVVNCSVALKQVIRTYKLG